MTEGPSDLPPGWRWTTIGEACFLNPRRPILERKMDAPTSFIPMNAVDESTGTIKSIETRPYQEVRSGYTYFEEGDVLFAKITPCMQNGKSAIARRLIDGIGFGSTEFHVLRPKPGCLSEWVWYFIRQKSFRDAAQKAFRGGVGQQRVPPAFLANYPLPLPPLEEQRRIVAKLNEVMAQIQEAKRLRAEARKDAELLMQSALAEVFPHSSSTLPPGWRWTRLGEIANTYSGSPAPQGDEYFKDGKWPFVRVQDLGRHGQTACLKETADYVNEHALKRYRLRSARAGTILFPKSGAAILTNTRAILGVNAYIVSHLAAVEPIHEILDNKWAYFWLCTLDMKDFIENPSYPSLRLSVIRKLPVPLPPLEEQRRIVAHLEEIQEGINILKEAQVVSGQELKHLETSILDKAFRGKL